MSGPPTQPAGFTYIPAPHERAYYGTLFQTADSERTGSIGGAKAVEFLTRSKLPVETLKHIWVAADQPPTNSLNHIKFAVAIRLIQLEQNGVKPTGVDLSAVPGDLRPPFFEGLNPPGSPSPSAAPTSLSPPQGTANLPPRPPSSQMAVADPQRPVEGVHPNPPQQPIAGQMTSGSSLSGQHRQLAVQDPYSLTPQERARYEQLFPEYAKDSQYMYGPEAVELFGKSGLEQSQLGRIWNMVDVPVDNRLDKLEFALAMHLIVCVSKKNLPLPASLPLSLKQLKSQQTAEMASLPSTIDAPRAMPPVGASTASTPGPANGVQSSLPGPPPLQVGGGGVSISEAFEGLGPPGDTGSIASFSRTNQIAATNEGQSSYANPQHIPPTVVETVEEDTPQSPEPAIKRVVEPAKPPASSVELAASYDMAESSVELEKLRSALQKLQAENISLKARLGSMSDEEQDIQKELAATIAEITKLSGDLTNLRAQVTASKSRLLEASAELKAAKEKKGMIQDLIAEATATKEAMDDAYEGIEKATEASRAVQSVPTPVPAQQTDLFGWGSEIAQGPATLPAPDLPQKSVGFAAEDPSVQTRSVVATEPLNAPSSHNGSDGPQAPQAVHQSPVFSFNQTATTPGSYNGGGYHNRNISSASGFGEVMGGSADLQSLADSIDVLPSTPSMKEIDDLKSQSREADAVARDAESSHRQLLAQMEELRRLADEAEIKSRSLADKPTKKKGLLRKGKKPDVKEIEKVAADAKRKRESLLEVQAQVKDAEALVLATRQEAEKLQKRAEDAQLQAATAASMQPNATKDNPDPRHAVAPGQSSHFAQPPGNFYNGANVATSNGYGQKQNGFDANVMASGGGFEIPTPQNDDIYSNPFSS